MPGHVKEHETSRVLLGWMLSGLTCIGRKGLTSLCVGERGLTRALFGMCGCLNVFYITETDGRMVKKNKRRDFLRVWMCLR